MSHLSLAFAPQAFGLASSPFDITDRGGSMAQADAFAGRSPLLDHEASREEDCILPAGIASMEHWLDLNA